MTHRAAILGASLTLQHVPELVRYGSKPSREPRRIPEILGALRSYEDAVAYAPNQACIGNLSPELLREHPRPWWRDAIAGEAIGAFGEILPQFAFYELMSEVDQFGLVRLK